MSTWDEIKRDVEEHQGVRTVTMDHLRAAHGAGKLGIHVRGEISNELAGMGLGHVPADLPTYSHEFVRLYKRGTGVGNFIEAVMKPGESNDRKIAETFGTDSANHASIIEQIRELVAE